MGSSQQKLVETTAMNLLIATALAILGIAAAEPGYGGYRGYGGYGSYHGGYRGYGGYSHIGKRSADAYTLGQVYSGLPYANAVATGYAHNPGYVAYSSVPAYTGYTGYTGFHGLHGYSYLG